MKIKDVRNEFEVDVTLSENDLKLLIFILGRTTGEDDVKAGVSNQTSYKMYDMLSELADKHNVSYNIAD